MRVKVTLTPLKTKTKYRIRGSRLFCSETGNELPRSQTLDNRDSVWKNIFASEIEHKKFIDQGRPIDIITDLNYFGYDSCDSSGKRKPIIRKDKLNRVEKSFVWYTEDKSLKLYFDFEKAKKAMSYSNCWAYTYTNKEGNKHASSGYLSRLINDLSQVIDQWDEKQIENIAKELENHFAWQEYALERFDKANLGEA